VSGSGYLAKIAIDPSIALGAELKASDLLFEFDERPNQNALQYADAQPAQAEALSNPVRDAGRVP
jgi:multidrug resistance efflux pump